MKFNIKGGVVIMMVGLLCGVLGLSFNLSMMDKIPIVIFSFVLVIIGFLMEVPFFKDSMESEFPEDYFQNTIRPR